MKKAKERMITNGKLPERVCPVCGAQVVKRIKYGQLSYACNAHWGPWDEAVRSSATNGSETMKHIDGTGES